LVFGMSVRPLSTTRRTLPASSRPLPVVADAATSTSPSSASPALAPINPPAPVAADGADSASGHLEWVADAILGGRIAFIFGVGAHLGAFDLAGDFYRALAARFGCPPELGTERSAIARHIADRFGRRVLWDAIRKALGKRVQPSVVHRFVAGLP